MLAVGSRPGCGEGSNDSGSELQILGQLSEGHTTSSSHSGMLLGMGVVVGAQFRELL